MSTSRVDSECPGQPRCYGSVFGPGLGAVGYAVGCLMLYFSRVWIMLLDGVHSQS